MAIGSLRRLAASAPVAIFVAIGRDAIERVEDLSLAPDIVWVASPRHAVVLLVAGEIGDNDRQALRVVHDQLPGLRATLWWGAQPFDDLASPVTLPLSADPLPHLRELHGRLWLGERDTELDLLANEPPAPWRGVGEHGQGGKGMMGGKPYGRPLAMTAEDLRDGLALDDYTVQIGPFLSTLPPGLVLELVLQGDVIQHANVIQPPLPPTRGDANVDADDGARAHADAQLHAHADADADEVTDTDAGSASANLRCVAQLLILLQLEALAERCRRAAQASDRGELVDIAALRRTLSRAGAFAAIPPGLGRGDEASGVDGDVRSRLLQWLSDAEQARWPHHQGRAPAASKAGPPWRSGGFAFTNLLTGLECNEAMLVINSFTPTELRRMSPPAANSGTQRDDKQPGGTPPSVSLPAQKRRH